MTAIAHTFHIPVLGTGYSADTPIRVAHFGISSVISLVDDVMLEQLGLHYARQYRFDYERIPRNDEDGRARRITAYLNLVAEAVRCNMDRVRSQPFFEANDKAKYFEMLPETSPLAQRYRRLLAMAPGVERDREAEALTVAMVAGSADVNIMVKLDRLRLGGDGQPLAEQFSDAKAALRGYARSKLESAIVLSAGINQSLFSYMADFQDFYRDATGRAKKRIIIKVSDLRSALVQEKFLAKKGLEVSEFRVESGLNCGGHAFETEGRLLPVLLQEFRAKRDEFGRQVRPMIKSFYEKMGWTYDESQAKPVLLTAQGGIGTSGEDARLFRQYGVDGTGWGTPFLLVPEATATDPETRHRLANTTVEEAYFSEASPLGVLFNNIRTATSQAFMKARIAAGTPGSPCPKGFAAVNNEYGETLCTASSEYQQRKLAELAAMEDQEEAARQRALLAEKECICHQLGNAALKGMGLVNAAAPVAICPGPNIAWFHREYTLREMVDHIYGRIRSLVPPERPHMFAQEITLNAQLLMQRIGNCRSKKEAERLQDYRQNLEKGMDVCVEIAATPPGKDENLASIPTCVEEIRAKLAPYYAKLEHWLHHADAAPAKCN